MANVATPPLTGTENHQTPTKKTRKFKFTPVPTAASLPNKQNNAGDVVDVVIVGQ